jgi:other hect domain ubiquitin protein ligase E3
LRKALLREFNRQLTAHSSPNFAVSFLDLIPLQAAASPGSLAGQLASIRDLIFNETKMDFLQHVLDATGTVHEQPSVTIEGAVVKLQKQEESFRPERSPSTPNLSLLLANAVEAEFVLPEDDPMFSSSTFGIAFRQLSKCKAASFRQKRPSGTDPHFSLRVIFKGEHVEGEGGPYRQFFTDIAEELKSERLPLLIPVPNAVMQGSANRDAFMLAPGRRSVQDFQLYRFLGILMGIAIRTNVLLPIELPSCFWKPLVNLPVTVEDLQQIDDSFKPALDCIRTSPRELWEGESKTFFLKFTCELSDHTLQSLLPDGDQQEVTFDNRLQYADLFEAARLAECSSQVMAVREGMRSIIPASVWALFTWQELAWRVCGKPFIEVSLLKRHTIYDPSIAPTEPHIVWFWEVLESMTQVDLRKFVRFAWAQELLPADDAEFIRTRTAMKIKPFLGPADTHDHAFPKADTCFFNVQIPRYSSKEILESKLRTAINEVSSMDADELHAGPEFADDDHLRRHPRFGVPFSRSDSSENSSSDD